MGATNSVLPHLTAAAQSLSKAADAAREAGDDVAAQIIDRAVVINASAIEQLIHPVDSIPDGWTIADALEACLEARS